ncbi:MAG: hypothetical protein GTN49_01995 [candidate division Zixibacteria bacterium]|nr:hypothetical protein [candidate division Zixibacteria bacterium]
MAGYRKYIAFLARALGIAVLLFVAFAYSYVVWRAAAYAWAAGLRFYRSELITADALRDGVHCFLLGVGVLVLPRFAGVGVPDVKKGGWALYAFAALAAAAAVVVVANNVRPFFTSPFAGKGPLFFTLGPLAWELMWPGFVFGFATALVGPRRPPAANRALVAVLTLAGTIWYAPLVRWMNPFDAVGFVAVTLAVSFLSLTLRRRTGSIWPGLAGHVLVKFFLAW